MKVVQILDWKLAVILSLLYNVLLTDREER